MTPSPPPILTDAATLRRLADGGSFNRGEGYFARGQVRAMRFDGEQVTATVSGEDYRVRLWREGGDLGWSCTCPVGDQGARALGVAASCAARAGNANKIVVYEYSLYRSRVGFI
ncbi:MAG: hypothetical protein WCJ64_01955 [Rhodospirillaceae bacterium]